jgi:hypothetical protein
MWPTMSMQRTDRHVMPEAGSKNRIAGWIDQRLPIFTLLRHELNEYSAPTFHTSVGKDCLI